MKKLLKLSMVATCCTAIFYCVKNRDEIYFHLTCGEEYPDENVQY